MVTEATKELFALINLACGAGIFLILAGYLFVARPRRSVVALALLLVSFLCAINSVVLYFLL